MLPRDLSAPGSPLQKALGLIDAMQAKAAQPAAGRHAASGATSADSSPVPAPGLAPSMQQGGLVPRTGTYTLHRGETVVPNDIQRALAEGQVQPEEAFGSPEEQAIPEGKWFVHSKTGIPFQARENPDPDTTWRLVFDEDQLAEAFPHRLHEGYPILVNPGVLHARDWLSQIDKARTEQYETPGFHTDYARSYGGEPKAVPMEMATDYARIHGRLTPSMEVDTPLPGPPANSSLDAWQGSPLKGYPGQLEPAP